MRFTKPIAAALALTVGAAAFAGSAEAGHRHRHNDAAIAGLFGLAAGTILGAALSRPAYHYYEPAPVYGAPPPPVVYAPAPVIYSHAPVVYEPAPVVYSEPWTPEWYAYCDANYVSFDSRTGYFVGYDGAHHFCR